MYLCFMRLLTVSYIIGLAMGAWLMARLPVETLAGVVVVLAVASVMVRNRTLATAVICSAIAAIGMLRVTHDIISVAGDVFGQEQVVGSFYDSLLASTAEQRGVLLEKLGGTELTEESKAIVGAMALGEKSAVTETMRDVYSHSGASHVLAISGMHIGVIFALLMAFVMFIPRVIYKLGDVVNAMPWLAHSYVGRHFVMFALRLPDVVTIRRFSIPFVCLTIWGYALLVGMSNSVLRSAVMLTIAALCMLLKRQTRLPDTLTLAAFCILLFSPLSAFDVGFQMSFMAVLGIAICYEPLSKSLFLVAKKLDKSSVCIALWDIVSLSLAAQLFVLPLTAFYFGSVSLVGVVSSLMLAVTAVVLLWTGLAMLAIVAIGPSLPLYGVLTWLCTSILNHVVHFQNAVLQYLSALPCAYFTVGGMSIYQLLLIYIIIGGMVFLVKKH